VFSVVSIADRLCAVRILVLIGECGVEQSGELYIIALQRATEWIYTLNRSEGIAVAHGLVEADIIRACLCTARAGKNPDRSHKMLGRIVNNV